MLLNKIETTKGSNLRDDVVVIETVSTTYLIVIVLPWSKSRGV